MDVSTMFYIKWMYLLLFYINIDTSFLPRGADTVSSCDDTVTFKGCVTT